MFGIGATELVIIGVVLLIAVGPNRLPKLLKAVVSSYREFRRATRELRASTGIDEILQDEDLRDLRKPLVMPDLGIPKKGPLAAIQQKKIAAAEKKQRSLTYTERVQENPPEGVDLAEIRYLEGRPSDEEREAIRSAKQAKYDSEQAIVQAKIAAAAAPPEPEEPLTEEQIAARVAEKEVARAEERRVIAAKIAAAEAQAREAERGSEEEE
ncbi:MAG: twin-arginine translocase TatA/TatE family subunit [Sandaracinaceae bacterium]|nr:twin-arginine translocase TatA/TatE family subunit [Sandaracinaceae bacterium]